MKLKLRSIAIGKKHIVIKDWESYNLGFEQLLITVRPLGLVYLELAPYFQHIITISPSNHQIMTIVNKLSPTWWSLLFIFEFLIWFPNPDLTEKYSLVLCYGTLCLAHLAWHHHITNISSNHHHNHFIIRWLLSELTGTLCLVLQESATMEAAWLRFSRSPLTIIIIINV